MAITLCVGVIFSVKKASIHRFFLLMFLQVMATNMVHPVTPAFLKALEMPPYMFGAAFAAMAATNFLFCPFWGRVGDAAGRVKTMFITTVGYAAGQLLFLTGTTVPGILAARLAAGIFGGGCTVCFMAYVADVSEPEQVGRRMAVCAALTSAGIAAGYLLGGVLGDFSVRAAFIVQCAILCIAAVLTLLFLRDGEGYRRRPLRLSAALNPFSAFVDARHLISPPTAVFLGVVFISCFATTAYDNSFNFYLRDQFAFPTSYNGYIYAAVGAVGLIVNMTVGMWIQRNADCRKALVAVLALSGTVLLGSMLLNSTGAYIGVNMLFYVFHAMYLPLQQALIIRDMRMGNGGVSGIFSSVRAVGMIAGALSAGFLYTMTPRLPLLVGACAFLLAALLSWLNRRQYEKKEQEI